MTGGLILLFAFCCGAIVANIYYAQPIIALIAPDIQLAPSTASLIVSLTQIGYALGLFFLVPLGDLLENRKLMITTAVISIICLVISAFTHHAGTFLAISLLVGVSSVAVQILIPLAAHLASDASRGRVVGNIMSGLLLGILLSRPVSSFIASQFGWRAVFGFAAVLMTIVTLTLALTIPARQPDTRASYTGLIRSLGTLFVRYPTLRQRSLYQGLMFGAFTLFWTAVPVELMRHQGLTQIGVAIFALVGATGACSAPIAGRLADAGHSHRATLIALLLAAASSLPMLISPSWGIAGLVITGVVLDFGVQMNMVLGQREIYTLDPASRNRLNALYMTSIFIGGSVGSSIASLLYEHGGWTWVALTCTLFPGLALLHFLFMPKTPVKGRMA
jgi:predicted MFS family arabinose efflux permease